MEKQEKIINRWYTNAITLLLLVITLGVPENLYKRGEREKRKKKRKREKRERWINNWLREVTLFRHAIRHSMENSTISTGTDSVRLRVPTETFRGVFFFLFVFRTQKDHNFADCVSKCHP